MLICYPYLRIGHSASVTTTGTTTDLPLTLPKVVGDSIEFTIGLGMRYLWIDTVSDADSKHRQISQMDSIYKNAEVTIIAAAEQDERFGLPALALLHKTHLRGFKSEMSKLHHHRVTQCLS